MQIYSLIAAVENLHMRVQNISNDIEKTGSFKAASVTDLIGDRIISMSSTVNSYSEPKAKYAALGLIAISLRIKNYSQNSSTHMQHQTCL